MKKILILAAALIALLSPATASAASDRCVVVVPAQGNEALFNACGQCRIVEVTRNRPGVAMKGKRTYAVPARAKIDLTFHGPGKTRIQSERPCRSSNIDQPLSQRGGSFLKDKKISCVKIQVLKNGSPALVNTCAVCRQVVIEYDIKGVGPKRETNTVKPRAYAILNPHPEATDARILRDRGCR